MTSMASDESSACSLPDFARELPILLVDHNSSSLSYMASFLQLRSFKVTTTGLLSVALSMLQQHNKTFKIVMANFDILDEAGISDLRKPAECDIPIIFYTSNPHKNAVARALEAGANFLMDMPVSDQNLKYIWQHALRSKSVLRVDDVRICPKRKREDARNSQDCIKTSDGKQADGIVLVGSERNTKRLRTSSTIVNEQVGDDSNPVEETGGGENIPVEGSMEKEANHSANLKKSRFVWNSKLQQKFTAALSALSDADVRPKAIWQMMEVPNLTIRQVASHLQKYKFQVQRMCDILTADLQPCKEPCCSRFVRGDSFQNLEKHYLLSLKFEDRNKDLIYHKELGPVTSKNVEQCVLDDSFSHLDQPFTPQSTSTTTTTTTSRHTSAGVSMGVQPKQDYFDDLSGILCQEMFFSSSWSSQPSQSNNGPGGDNWEMELDLEKSPSPPLSQEEMLK